MIEAMKHYEAALLKAFPKGASGDVFEHWNKARQAIAEAEQNEPFEYWNAVEGWVKIDEVRRHFDSVGCGTIYKRPGEGRVPLYLAQPRKPLTDAYLYLASLVEALDGAFILSSQSTCAWQTQLDEARDYLAAHGIKE